MKKRWLLPAGVLVLLVIPILVLAVIPGSWFVSRLETTASAYLGVAVSIDELQLDILSSTPAVTLLDVSIGDGTGNLLGTVERLNVAIDAGELLGGDLVFDRIDVETATLRLGTDVNGKHNWQDLLPANEAADDSQQAPSASLPSIVALDLSDVTIDYQNAQTGLSANILVDASGSTVAGDFDTRVSATGEINDQALELELQTDPLLALSSGEGAVAIDAQLNLGDTLMTADGTIGDLTAFRDLDLMVSMEAPALDDLAELIDVPLPVIPPYRIAGSIKRDGDDVILRRFDGELGDSDIQGDVRLDMTTTPVTLYANVISRILDLDDLAGIIGARADAGETPMVDDRLPASPVSRKLLPDEPLNLMALANSFNGAIQYQALAVRSPVWPVDALDVRIEVQSDRLVLSPMNMGLAGGRVVGSMNIELDQTVPAAILEAHVNMVELKQVMAAIGIDDDSFGNLGGRLKFWMNGRSISELMASADGGIFLLMTGGRLDALLAEIAGIDLFESISLLLDPEKTRTDIRCAYLDLHADNGIAEFNRFVVDTDDTVFLAEGRLDFNDESLDLVVEPHPKDVSLFAAQTAVNVLGTFTEPTVQPGKALGTRVAVAAVLAAVATPAAALLPFIQPGAGQDSPFCDGLIETIDDGR